MNELDPRIHDLFINLVNSKTKYLTKIDYNRNSLVYKINNKEVTLKAYTKSDKDEHKENSFSDATKIFKNCIIHYYDVFWCDPKNGMDFVIYINDKHYDVNCLSRIEYAKAFDTLDETIRSWEDRQIEEVSSAFYTFNEII